ncbi:MAG: flippase [Candidatus Aenigmatarchaeota archaeon]
MKLINYYVINVVAQGLGRVFTFGSNFIAFALIARFLSSEVFGQYSYVLNYFGIIVILADFGLMSILGKDIAQKRESPQIYWGNFLFLRLCINVIMIFVSIVCAYFIRKDLFLLLFIGSFAIPFLASRFFEPVFQVFKRPWDSTIASLVYGISHLVFVFMAFKLHGQLIYFVLAYIFANIIYGFFAFYLSFKSVRPLLKINKSVIKDILKLAAPLGISSIFITISNRISILMLASMKSDYAVGIYSASYKFVEISAFLAAMATAPLIPIFAEKAKISTESIKNISGDIFESMAIILLPTGIVCSYLSQEIITLIYGVKLLPSIEVFEILIWVCVIIFYSLLTASIVISIGTVRFAYWLGALAAVLSILLNYLLIPKLSYLGSAWAALICEIVLVGVTLSYATRNIGNFFRLKTWVLIAVLNLFLFFLINQKIIDFNIYIKTATALIFYFLCVWRLDLLRTDVFELLKLIKR